MRHITILFAILFSVLPLHSFDHAIGRFIQKGEALVGNDSSGPSAQGKSVFLSADGNTAIVGGYDDNRATGAAWIYTRTASGWTQQGGKLVGTGASNPTRQGVSVGLSADGNTAIVGGYQDGGGVGAAWMFTRTVGIWSQQGPKLVGSGYGGSPLQGICVALSGDGKTAIIAGQFDNNDDGAVWIFVRNGSSWRQQGNKLVGTGASARALQGQSVALSMDGNTAAVGATGDRMTVGAVWIFTRSDTTWTQQGGKLVGSGFAAPSSQGASVSFSNDGNTLLIGGHYDNSNAGAAWVFTRSNGLWSQEGNKLIGTGAVGPAMYGRWVSLSADGNTALIGGFRDNDETGAIWMLTRSSGVWSQLGTKLTVDGIGAGSLFGSGVSISGDGKTILAGAEGYNGGVGGGFVFTEDSVRVATDWSLK